MAKIKLYLLASGDIAVPVLERLCRATEIELLGIATQADRRAGRKRQLQPTAIGAYCAQHNLPVLKPASVNAPDFISHLRALQPDIILVMAYGQLLKQPILELPRLLCLNIHASILPKYRGASPITQAILNRDKYTGNSFMAMERGLDTGPVFRIVKLPLHDNEYADELEMKLGQLAAEHVVATLVDIAAGRLTAEPQDDSLATTVGKISKTDGIINWQADAATIEAMVRAYYPWPGAVFQLDTRKGPLKIQITAAEICDITASPGRIVQADKHGLIIACGSGALKILKLIPQGKKEMTGRDFLNGYPVSPGTVLS